MKKLTIGVLVLSLLMTFSIVGVSATSTSHDINMDIGSFIALGLTDSTSSGGTDAITFTLTSSEVSAGSIPDNLTNSDKSLNYLAIVDDSNNTIDAKLGSDTSSVNYDLLVEATSISGDGTLGSSAGQITLSSGATDLITGIGTTLATADLTYTLDFTGVPEPDTSTTYEVTYTITDVS